MLHEARFCFRKGGIGSADGDNLESFAVTKKL